MMAATWGVAASLVWRGPSGPEAANRSALAGIAAPRRARDLEPFNTAAHGYTVSGSLASGFSRSMISLSRQCQLAHPQGESPLASRIVRSAPAANRSLIVSIGA